ncbi:MAG: argininosuccinate lyase [Chitinophagaceae bacterium]|nr:argininosuccinate lyase [Chitinophagaceae bacterium]
MKLWQKNVDSKKEVDLFTVGDDRKFDLLLAPFDVLGTMAHIRMLCETGLLEKADYLVLKQHLTAIYEDIRQQKFSLNEDVEDIHSQIEWMLTQSCGDAGKKVHTARSRNDQVLVDIKLYLRSETEKIVHLSKQLFDLLIELSEKYKEDLLPGYTHFQLAMPSSFGLWFGAYAESISDDLVAVKAAWDVINKNPLGSAAGFGSSFPIDRSMTTRLLGFENMNYNVVYAQMTRGKSEKILLQSLSNLASTLSRFSMDCCIFMNQNFGFISFPEEFTTGSSIMPHKKNPDVFELIRAHCNLIQESPNQLRSLMQNLPSGYQRDYQLTKEVTFPAIKKMKDCIVMMSMMMKNVVIKKGILRDEKYKYLFTVEEMNKLVLKGMPLRDAYRKIGEQVNKGTFKHSGKLHHTHEGSMGNLMNDAIAKEIAKTVKSFHFEKAHQAIQKLLQ